MPGSASNWRRTSLITLTAAFVTAPIASAENQHTSIAPKRPPTNTSGFEMSTAASGEPRRATSSRYAEKSRHAASAAEPIAALANRLGLVGHLDDAAGIVGDRAERVHREDVRRRPQHPHRGHRRPE